ncbi:Heterokaryon incompatibility 6-like protein [Cladobotryum mycophilum]|uniref:Heterokaryon incompatibility 6-like protein n=1 Tax=Cladobotryum mycophilum TaxID=491253 RepID=A0ABR0SJT0_9HYPO
MPLFNQYYYEPLYADDAIRLIVLGPATKTTTPLSCSIIQQRLTAPTVSYSAVSYAWGKRELLRNLELKCDGDTSYLRITPNVDTLLRHLRARKLPRHLWIDAVCLNQDDEEEKAQQIPIMRRIYEEANEVQIWLGSDSPLTAASFSLFRKINMLGDVGKMEMARRIAKLGAGPLLLGNDILFNRPWFSRRWVIQEACLARQATVHCGTYSIPLPLLCNAAKRIQSLDISWYAVKMMTMIGGLATKPSILELLWNFHEASCLEPRDRIASLWGLVRDDHHRFQLDYTLHWTELYKQVASFAFSLGDNDTSIQVLLHLFEFGPLSRPGDVTYPSWVPDWAKTRQRTLPYHSQIPNPDTYEPYPASLEYSEKATLTFHHDALKIRWNASIGGPRGRQVIYARKFDALPLDNELRGERLIHLLHELFPSTSDSVLEILALASFIKMLISFHYPPKEEQDQRRNSASFDRHIGHISQFVPPQLDAQVLKFLRNLDWLLQHFCLFQMEPFGPGSEVSRGYGIGPQLLQVGDIMIPLWRLENSGRYQRFMDVKYPATRITTMLAVRRIGEQSLPHETAASGQDVPIQNGRIIGPAVCIMLRDTRYDMQEQAVDVKVGVDADKEQQSSMRLV